MDLDADGRSDIISGSWPGEIYWFRRNAHGSFAAAEKITDRDGKEINVGSAASAFFADWDADGDLDLLVGTIVGEIYLVPNEGSPKKWAFGKPQRLTAVGKPISIPQGDAAPIAADWDDDGKLDLIVGSEEGSVVWFRNVGKPQSPELAEPETLIEKSPLGWGSDSQRSDRIGILVDGVLRVDCPTEYFKLHFMKT